MFISVLTAYGLARKDLMGRNWIMFMFVFTMLFNGGMIPTFLAVKETGLLDSYLALIIPVSINVFNMIILKTFFQGLPDALEKWLKSTAATISAYCSESLSPAHSLRLRQFRFFMR